MPNVQEILDAEERGLNRQIEEAAQLVAEATQRLRDLKNQAAVIARLRVQFDELAPKHAPLNGKRPQAVEHPTERGQKIGPTPAILEFVGAHPGSQIGEVIRAVLPQIETKSGNPKRLVYSLVKQLMKQGRINRDGERGLTLNNNSN